LHKDNFFSESKKYFEWHFNGEEKTSL
jgi:hypothetical protein